MLALRDRSGAAPSLFCGCRAISTVAGAAPRRRDTSGARWRRYAGDRLAGRFPWSGWGARESLPGHPSHGRRIGPRHGPILSPSPSVVAPARVASRGYPRPWRGGSHAGGARHGAPSISMVRRSGHALAAPGAPAAAARAACWSRRRRLVCHPPAAAALPGPGHRRLDGLTDRSRRPYRHANQLSRCRSRS